MAHIGNDAELRAGALGFAVGDISDGVSGAARTVSAVGFGVAGLPPSMPVARSLRAARLALGATSRGG